MNWRSLAKLPLGGEPWANNGHFVMPLSAPTSEFFREGRMPWSQLNPPPIGQNALWVSWWTSQTNLQSDFIWHDFTIHHPWGKARISCFFFFLGGGASHCFAIFFFSNEFVAQKELMGKWRNSRSRGKGPRAAKCQGRPSSAVGWRFFVFSFPPGSVYYLSQKSPYFWRVESRSLWHAFDHI